MPTPTSALTRLTVCADTTRPDGWGPCGASATRQFGLCGRLGSVCGVQPGGGVLDMIAPSVLNSTPAEAVVSLVATVLLTMLTFNASCRDTPPPS